MPDAALGIVGGLVLEDGRRWGEAAEPWQSADARAVLDLAGPRRHFWTRPRGASKTSDAAGVAIAVLLEQAPRGSRSYVLAADREQGGLVVDSVQGFRDRTPDLASGLDVQTWRIVATRTGATIDVLPADEASSWGLRPYFVVVSEFTAWKETPGPKRLWRSIFSALPKVPGSRLVVESNAGDPSHFSYGVLERAKANPDRWRVSEIPGPCPWIDEDDLAEQRAELPEWEYARLHLNRWVESEDRLTSVDDLAACSTLTDWPVGPRRGLPYVVTVDLGLTHDATVAAVCHAEAREDAGGYRVALDRLATWRGSRREPVSLGLVEAWVLQAAREYGAPLVADPWQAAMLCQRLRARGLRVDEFAFTAASVGRLGSALFTSLRDHALALPAADHDDEAAELHEELSHVRLRETSPGVVRLDHDAGRHDDRAIALALAVQWFRERWRPVLEPPKVFDEKTGEYVDYGVWLEREYERDSRIGADL